MGLVPGRLFLIALVPLFLLTGEIPATMASEVCPQPRCFVAESMPDDIREDRAQSRMVSLNRDSVRFQMGGRLLGTRKWIEQELGYSLSMLDEYTLTSSSTPDSVTLTVSDGRGRPVHSATADTPEAVAEAMTPLIEKIREHQRKVREEEHIAVDSWIYTSPKSAKIEVDESVDFAIELIDCDGYELFDRTVEIEVAGPGSVEPATVQTDKEGRAEFTFTGDDPGTATITIWYVHEAIELEGVKSASGDHRIVVEIEGQGVRSHLELSGDGYTADYDAWNCTGIAGDWRLRGELDVTGYGTISGEGEFYVPPRPEDGPWESEPFSYTMTGALDMDGATADVTYEFQDVVFTIIELEDGPTLGDSRGTAKATVKVTTPEFSMVVSETYVPVSLAPALIRNETHPSCQ